MATKLLKTLNDALLTATFVSFLSVPRAFPANPVPTVIAPVIPQAVPPGSGAFTLRVYGANFVPGAVGNWNASPRSTTFVSRREVDAKILASDVAQPTMGHITVSNPGPGGGNSSSSYAVVEVHTPDPTVIPAKPHNYQLKTDFIFSLLTGDFYSHNKLDLLAGGLSGNVYLLEGNGDGTFRHTSVVGDQYSGSTCNLGVGDFNNDGKLDFVFPAGSQTASITVRLNNGNGSFRTSWRHGAYDSCPPFAVGDFDGDGNLDFVAVLGNAMDIFLGNGDGTFRKGRSYVGPYHSALVADFNGDGILDLVVNTDGGLRLLLGKGDGTFRKPRTIIKLPANKEFDCGEGQSLVVNDFNGDGNADLATCYVSALPPFRSPGIIVLLGNGDGTFKKPVHYHAGYPVDSGGTWAFAAGDFNSDGKTDFIDWYSTGNGKWAFAILKGNGDGTFQKQTTVKLPDNMEDFGIVPGDFTSDGLLDFIIQPLGGLQSYTQK